MKPIISSLVSSYVFNASLNEGVYNNRESSSLLTSLCEHAEDPGLSEINKNIKNNKIKLKIIKCVPLDSGILGKIWDLECCSTTLNL